MVKRRNPMWLALRLYDLGGFARSVSGGFPESLTHKATFWR